MPRIEIEREREGGGRGEKKKGQGRFSLLCSNALARNRVGRPSLVRVLSPCRECRGERERENVFLLVDLFTYDTL